MATYIEYKDDESKHAVKGADISEFLDGFRNAGYVLTDNDLIIDVDDIEHSTIEKMMEIFNINTETVKTDRGYHLYFRKPAGFRGAQGVAPIGFKVEYKHMKNTKDITVKRRGKAREVLNRGVREELPFILSNERRKLEDMTAVDEGDGRNNKLFKHKMSLNNHKDSYKILSFINEYLFDVPLDQSEFETVAREQKSSEGSGALTVHDLSQRMINQFDIVSFGEALYFKDPKDNDSYVFNVPKLTKIVHELSPEKDARKTNNIIDNIVNEAPERDLNMKYPVKFNNGVLQDGEFTEVEYREFTPFHIPRVYNEDAAPVPIVDDFLNQLTKHDASYRKIIEEMLGLILETNHDTIKAIGKFFMMYGDGGNGKSTLLEILQKILTSKNFSSLSIKQIANDKFTPSLQGKLLNMGDDVEAEAIDTQQMKLLKNIATADKITIRKLYKQAEDVRMISTLLFTANSQPKSFEKGDSFQRRIVWLPVLTKPEIFSETHIYNGKKVNFMDAITTDEAMEYWVKLMVEGYMRLIENGELTKSEMVENFNKDYHENNNSFVMWCDDKKREDFIGVPSRDIRRDYKAWCEEEEMNIMSPTETKSNLGKLFGLTIRQKKINGVNLMRCVPIED
ncbi:phage/plasmid primase, P4 family [Staphylococcus equorum]|uniref:phage/plasmid primase, P4 family n=1 Tax=Staphylococcus equorum TaxID=246432 RepID=UPI003EBD02DF